MNRKHIRFLLLVVLFTLFISASALACDNNAPTSLVGYYAHTSEHEMVNELLNRGYPESFINSLDIQEKETLFSKENTKFKSIDSEEFYYNDSGFHEIKDTGIELYGQIPSTRLKIDYVISDYANGDILLYYHYEWKTPLPVNRNWDTIAISWDSSLYRPVAGSFEKTDKYMLDNGKTYIADDNPVFGSTSDSGVSWYAKLASSFHGLNTTTSLYGYGMLDLHPTKGYPEKSEYNSRYYHAINDVQIVIYIPEHGEFDMRIPVPNDSCAKDVVFDPDAQ